MTQITIYNSKHSNYTPVVLEFEFGGKTRVRLIASFLQERRIGAVSFTSGPRLSAAGFASRKTYYGPVTIHRLGRSTKPSVGFCRP